MTYKVALISTKGGVGKTTAGGNLGALFADFGLRTLLIDADVQPSLSKFYQLRAEAPGGLVEIVTRGTVESDCVSETCIPNLHLVRSNDPTGELQHWLHARPDRRTRLRDALASPFVTDNYDFVFIDTQGAVGDLQRAAAFAADSLLSPVPPDSLSAREFRSGTLAVLQQLEHDAMEPTAALAPIKAFICRLERTRDARLIVEQLRHAFSGSEKVTILSTAIPNAVGYKEAASHRVPVHRHEQRIRRAGSAFEVMHRLAWEVYPAFHGLFAGGFRADPDAVFKREATAEEGRA